MTLQFQQQLNNKPTFFVEKILAAFDDHYMAKEYYYENRAEIAPLCDWTRAYLPKLHTIREDKPNRWKKGNDTHFKVWSGKPYHSKNINFLPLVECISTQKIEIIYKDTDGLRMEIPTIYIDNDWIPFENIKSLAINDGFGSIEDFLNYFKSDFTGKIIHWTNLKY